MIKQHSRGSWWPCPDWFNQTVNQINRYVEPEGWALTWFTADDGSDELMIQRDDMDQKFGNDLEAQAHVRRLANEGSAIHALAIQIVEGGS